MASRLTPPSSGRPGPGEIRTASGRCGPDARHVDGVVAEHHGLGARARPAPGPGCRRRSRSCRRPAPGVPWGDDRTGPPPGASRRGWLTSHPVATSTKGPGGASRKGKSASGRSRPRSAATRQPRRAAATRRRSPRACATARRGSARSILVLLIGGVAVITVNYLAHLPLPGARLTVGPGRRPGDDLRRLPAGHPVPLTTASAAAPCRRGGHAPRSVGRPLEFSPAAR